MKIPERLEWSARTGVVVSATTRMKVLDLSIADLDDEEREVVRELVEVWNMAHRGEL